MVGNMRPMPHEKKTSINHTINAMIREAMDTTMTLLCKSSADGQVTLFTSSSNVSFKYLPSLLMLNNFFCLTLFGSFLSFFVIFIINLIAFRSSFCDT